MAEQVLSETTARLAIDDATELLGRGDRAFLLERNTLEDLVTLARKGLVAEATDSQGQEETVNFLEGLSKKLDEIHRTLSGFEQEDTDIDETLAVTEVIDHHVSYIRDKLGVVLERLIQVEEASAIGVLDTLRGVSDFLKSLSATGEIKTRVDSLLGDVNGIVESLGRDIEDREESSQS